MTVTDAAKEELGHILATRNLDSGRFLRLTVPPTWDGPGDFGIVIDVEGNGDHAIELDGLKVLLLDSALFERLAYSVLDCKHSPEGPSFTLDVF